MAQASACGKLVAGARPSRISDIDVAVDLAQPLPRGLLAEIHDTLEESGVLYPVDLVDLSEVAPALRRRVETEGVLWSA